MRGGMFSKLSRSLTASLGACLLLGGCGDGSVKNEAQTSASTTSSAVVSTPAATSPAVLPPTDRYAAGERYANVPRVDPAVQPVGYVETTAATKRLDAPAVSAVPGLPDSPEEPEFVPGIEDLQLFEQPDFSKQPATPPAGFFDPSVGGLNRTPQTRANPLPHSP